MDEDIEMENYTKKIKKMIRNKFLQPKKIKNILLQKSYITCNYQKKENIMYWLHMIQTEKVIETGKKLNMNYTPSNRF